MVVATELEPNIVKRLINDKYDPNQIDNKFLDPHFEGPLVRGVFFMDEVRPYHDGTGKIINAEARKVCIYEQTEAGQMLFRDMTVSDVSLESLSHKKISRPDVEKFGYINFQCGNIAPSGLAFTQDSALLTSYIDDVTSYTEFESSAGAAAGVRSPSFTVSRLNHSPKMGCVLRTGPVAASVRLWVGLFDTAPMNNDGPNNYVGFRRIDGSGVGWQAVARSNGGAVTAVTLTTSLAPDTHWNMYMEYDKVAAKMKYTMIDVNGVKTTAEIAGASLPSVSQNLGWAARVDSQDALQAQKVRLSRLFVASK